MKRFLYPVASLIIALGVGVYAYVMLGRVTASAIFLVFTTVALAWVVWILYRSAEALIREPEAEEVARASGRRKKELEREKQALLKALKELEFDYQMGKVSEADYQEIGGNYRARAVRVLRQLDVNSGESDYKQLVERDLLNRRKAKGGEPGAVAAEVPAALPTEVPAQRAERPSCRSCATANDADAEFCKKCGKRMLADEAAR